MLIKKDQKINIIIAASLAIILIAVSVWNQTSFTFIPGQQKNNSDYQKYQELLSSIKPDEKASKELMQKLITEEEVKVMVETELKVNQKITTPLVAASEVNIAPASDKDSVTNYFKTLAEYINTKNAATLEVSELSFGGNSSITAINAGLSAVDSYITSLKSMSVPSELVTFHQAQLVAAISHKTLLETAKNYQIGQTDKPWPEVYKEFVIANKQFDLISTEFQKVDKKYSIKDVALVDTKESNVLVDSFNIFKTKEAKAVLGVGDTVVVVGDIPSAIEKAIKQGFAAAFGRFMSKFLDQMITKIEQNYRIANFMYYADELFTGQYADDYLRKNVPDIVDREIIKRFLPEFSCGINDGELKEVLRAKAQSYLGFDDLSFDDPDYENKLARVGDFMSSDIGQWAYYLDKRDAASNATNAAITRELGSSGLKSQRSAGELISSQITASLNLIESSQTASLNNSLSLGVVNAENLISSLVSGILDNLFSKFLFQGAVFIEKDNKQDVCSSLTPLLKPLIPSEPTDYETPNPNPDPDDRYINPNLNANQEANINGRIRVR